MTDLTKDKVAWTWGDGQENSFRALKVAIATAPILRLLISNISSLSQQMLVMWQSGQYSNRISGQAYNQ